MKTKNTFHTWTAGLVIQPLAIGYQKYLRQQDCRAVLRSLRQSAADISEFNDGPQLQETLIQLGLTDIFRALRDGKVRCDLRNHIRIFNALARLNHEALNLNKFKSSALTESVARPPAEP